MVTTQRYFVFKVTLNTWKPCSSDIDLLVSVHQHCYSSINAHHKLVTDHFESSLYQILLQPSNPLVRQFQVKVTVTL